MDLAYLRAHPQTIPRLVEHQRIRVTPLGSAKGGRAERWTLDDGTHLFAKIAEPPSEDTMLAEGLPAEGLPAEGRALCWLAEPAVAAVPEVLTAIPGMLVTAWIETSEPTVAGAERFGRDLAALHASGAPAFGLDRPGVLATLPLENTPEPGWAPFYVKHRCAPFLRAARDAGTLTSEDAAAIEIALERIPAAAGPAEPPARIHGDLWSGNVLPGADGRWWLIDPAAHGGHRETDLAMLALFGAPSLARILGAYHEAAPLAPGWPERVPMHQLHPLLVHCVLFGRRYVARTLAAARAVP